MPRRAKVVRRIILPDPRFNSRMLAKFINRIMMRGKKSTAERIVYSALGLVENRLRRNPIDVFDTALRNATPILEVKPRRVGGATYQVPVEIRGDRRVALAMRWLILAARARPGKSMAEKLSAELMDASSGQGATIKRREDTHRMAEANKAFSHYRW
ncbi:MAG: 30S ribosomal protein S7 [Chloroflexota bacterium]|nr:MAG: 30S ribosomal protein S7 [Chloroflexota bacterium]